MKKNVLYLFFFLIRGPDFTSRLLVEGLERFDDSPGSRVDGEDLFDLFFREFAVEVIEGDRHICFSCL